MGKVKNTSPPGTEVFQRHQEEYGRYVHLTESIQRDLLADVEELRAQEAWNEELYEGVRDWVDDKDSIWRLLRRHRYDESKIHAALLTGLAKRILLSLHRPIPSIPPYSDSALCYILPLPRYTDIMGRPIVIFSLREVRRDGNGKMDDLKEWSWWALEMIRRCLKDYWAGDEYGGSSTGTRGKGGEGCVILVDAAGAGYRNLEVEMLPTLLSVGHNHFPGIFDAVYVVNAGWTHRSMWAVIKRVLPKSALDKIIFLDKKADVERVFDLDILPKHLGGNDEMTFETLGNPILNRYSQPLSTPTSKSPIDIQIPKSISPSGSSTSIADIYMTAQNTPSSSRRHSIATGMGLHMSRPPPPPLAIITTTNPEPQDPLTRQSSRTSTSSPGGALRKIKSLSDFHLYLSPSRLAHLDVLSDSDSDSDVEELPPPRIIGTMGRRQRPHMQVLGKIAGEDARSYSGRLQAHHAKVLDGYKESRMTEAFPSRTALDSAAETGSIEAERVEAGPSSRLMLPERPSTPSAPTTPGPPILPTTEAEVLDGQVQPISAFQSDINPYYGYPAILTGTTVRPRYHRNRKRDLVKTLLFLFILRIQSWRDAFERFLGLNNLGTWSMIRSIKQDPGTGLVRSNSKEGKEVVKRVEKDWIWMAITFILLRGTWARILGGPLDAMGLGGVRGMLGLV